MIPANHTRRNRVLMGLAASALIGLFSGHAMAADYEVSASAGLGYDSNVFRAPDGPYRDMFQAPINPLGNLADPTNYPLVTPTTQTGFFVPLELDVATTITTGGAHNLLASYVFDGDIYSGDADNGTETRHQVKLGQERVFGQQRSRKDSLYLGAMLTRRDKIYVERDDGTEKLSGTTNVADRFSYTGYGLEAVLKHRTSRIQYGVQAEIEYRDYSSVGNKIQYDSTNYTFGGHAKFKLADPTKLKVSAKYAVEDYSDRRPRDLNGTLLPSSGPKLTYSYLTANATLRQRLGGGFTGYLGYTLKIRTDSHLGYNDYTQSKANLRLLYKRDALRGKLAVAYSTRSYDNAFAFENPAAAEKDYDTVSAKLSGEYALSEALSLWGEATYRQVTTNDTRFEFDRNKVLAGVRWTL